MSFQACLVLASAVGEGMIDLLFGWLLFLIRTLQRVTVDRAAVVVAAVAVLLFAVGVHLAARASLKHFGVRDGRDQYRWRIRSTLVVVVGLFVLFGAGISLIGTTHQVVWLATSDEPKTGEAFGGYAMTDSRQTLKWSALAIHNYIDTFNDGLAGGSFDERGNALHSWESRILVFLNYENPIDFTVPWRHQKNEPHFRSVLGYLINPDFRVAPVQSEEGFGLSHYASNINVMGPNLVFDASDVDDGASNTILLGEVNKGFRAWGDPVNWRDPAAGLGARADTFGGPASREETLFVMVDGSVRGLSSEIDEKVLKAMASPSRRDGE